VGLFVGADEWIEISEDGGLGRLMVGLVVERTGAGDVQDCKRHPDGAAESVELELPGYSMLTSHGTFAFSWWSISINGKADATAATPDSYPVSDLAIPFLGKHILEV
jgi:hypothetical protein